LALPEPAEAASLGGTRRRRPFCELPADEAHEPATRLTSALASAGETAATSSLPGIRSTLPARNRFMSPSNADGLPRNRDTMSWSVRAPVLAESRRAIAERLSPRRTS